MFPSIFALGVAELGLLTGNGSGLMNMAIVGGAIIPVIQGAVSDSIGIHHAFFLPVICYLYILILRAQRLNAEQRTLCTLPGHRKKEYDPCYLQVTCEACRSFRNRGDDHEKSK